MAKLMRDDARERFTVLGLPEHSAVDQLIPQQSVTWDAFSAGLDEPMQDSRFGR